MSRPPLYLTGVLVPAGTQKMEGYPLAGSEAGRSLAVASILAMVTESSSLNLVASSRQTGARVLQWPHLDSAKSRGARVKWGKGQGINDHAAYHTSLSYQVKSPVESPVSYHGA